MGFSNWGTLDVRSSSDYIMPPLTATLSSNPDPMEVDLRPVITTTGFRTSTGAIDTHIETVYTIIDPIDGSIVFTYTGTAASSTLLSVDTSGMSILLNPRTDYRLVVQYKGAAYGIGAPIAVNFLTEDISVTTPTVADTTYPTYTLSPPVVDNGLPSNVTTVNWRVTDPVTGALVYETLNNAYPYTLDVSSVYPFAPDKTYNLSGWYTDSVFGDSAKVYTTFTTPKIPVVITFPTISIPTPCCVVAPDSHVGTKIVIKDISGNIVCSKNITSGNLTSFDITTCNLNPDTDYEVGITYVLSQTGDRPAGYNNIHTPATLVPVDPTIATTFPVVTMPPPTIIAPDSHTGTEVIIKDINGNVLCTKNITTGNLLSVDVSSCNIPASTAVDICYTYVLTSGIRPAGCTSYTTPAAVPVSVNNPTFTVQGEMSNVPVRGEVTVSSFSGTNVSYSHTTVSIKIAGVEVQSASLTTNPAVFTPTLDYPNNTDLLVTVRHYGTATAGPSIGATIGSAPITKTVRTSYTVVPNKVINTPTVSVSGSPSSVPSAGYTISGSAFSATGGETHVSTTYEILQASNNAQVLSFTSTSAEVTRSFSSPTLNAGTSYVFKVKYNGTTVQSPFGTTTASIVASAVVTGTLLKEFYGNVAVVYSQQQINFVGAGYTLLPNGLGSTLAFYSDYMNLYSSYGNDNSGYKIRELINFGTPTEVDSAVINTGINELSNYYFAGYGGVSTNGYTVASNGGGNAPTVNDIVSVPNSPKAMIKGSSSGNRTLSYDRTTGVLTAGGYTTASGNKEIGHLSAYGDYLLVVRDMSTTTGTNLYSSVTIRHYENGNYNTVGTYNLVSESGVSPVNAVDNVPGMAISNDGQTVAIWFTEPNLIYVYKNGSHFTITPYRANNYASVAMSADGNVLAYMTSDTKVTVRTGNTFATEIFSKNFGATMPPELAYATSPDKAAIYKAINARLALSSDGKRLAIGMPEAYHNGTQEAPSGSSYGTVLLYS